ncbi:MAG: Phosphoenolpyruvate-protein phosphotransferase [Syntrophomonadaceae bacterium]|nr:Phosphoenolpyruvate-protein phosphotransferase [Bacillota bacterium]
MLTIKGTGVSPGIKVGKAFLLSREGPFIPRWRISRGEVDRELARFERAVDHAKKRIIQVKDKISREMGERYADIFGAHLLVLEDISLIEETKQQVREREMNAEYIFVGVLERIAKKLSALDDEYLGGRSVDIRDVGKRVLSNMIGSKRKGLSHIKEEVIIVAHDLSPSDTATMRKETILAFATDVGGKASHTAIMARAIEIPAVVGLRNITEEVGEDDTVIVDGTEGVVIINPDEETLVKYQKKDLELKTYEKEFEDSVPLPAQTRRGHQVKLSANIEILDEIPLVLSHGAAGIGLYRTEFFYINRQKLPTEDEHYEAYKSIVEKMAPYSVTIRTFDIGGDKFISQLQLPEEMSSFRDFRSIRSYLAQPEILKVQLKAILRAAVHGELRVMYPMISRIEELRATKEILDTAKDELRRSGIRFNERIRVGAMIETPSAVMTADILAKEVHFFSIGTNDLVQYSLAADRVDEQRLQPYEPVHPGILRLIKMVIDTAHREKIPVSICGEMASEPAYIPILLGMGLDEFSMSAIAIPEAKRVIRAITMTEAKRIARKCLTMSTAEEVDRYAREKLKKIAPDVKQYYQR